MGIAAAHALNVGLALLALGLGGHWLEWALTDEDDAAPRVSAFELAAQVHAAAGIAAFALALAPPRLTWVFALNGFGILLFCGALYGYGFTAAKALMPLTVPGIFLLVLGWIVAAWQLSRSGR